MKNKKLLVLASLLSLGFLAGCGGNVDEPTTGNVDTSSQTTTSADTSTSSITVVTVTGVTISGGVVSLEANETVQLSATVTLSSGTDTLGVTWTSSNDDVASVSTTGLVTAKTVTVDTDVTITATSKKDSSKKQTITIKILADANTTIFGEKKAIESGDEASLASGGICYWADQGWVSGTSTVDATKTYVEDNKISIGFTQTEGSAWFGTQIFYKNSSLTVGNPYKLTMKVTASVAGDITINKKVVHLDAGENNVVISYVNGATSLSIQFGVDGVSTVLAMDATFEIIEWKDISEDKVPLPAPTGVTVTAKEGVPGAYILGFDAVEHAAGYMYSVTTEDGTAIEALSYVAARAGDTIDLRSYDTGKYIVLVQAVGNGLDYADSAATRVEVNHTKPTAVTAQTYRANFGDTVSNLSFGEAANAGATPTYWNDQNWCGSNTAVSYAAMKGDQIQFEFSGATITYGFQLFQSDTNISAGSKYRLKMNLWSSAAGEVTINEHAVTLKAGDNLINIEFTASATSQYNNAQGTSLNFQNGAIEAAEIKMSNIRWTEVVEGQEDTDVGTEATEPEDLVTKVTQISAPVGVVYNANGTVAFANVTNATSYKATLFTDAACTTPSSIANVAITNGGSIDTTSLEAGTYYLVVYAVASDGTVSQGSTAVTVTLTGKLSAPVGVVFNKGTGTVAFAPVTGAESYKVTVFTDAACTTKSSIDEVTVTNGGVVDISSLEDGDYYIVVYAVSASGDLSDPSTAVKFTLSSAPVGPIAADGKAHVLQEGSSATRVDGAGVWIWVDTASIGVTGENFGTIEVNASVSMKDAGGAATSATVNDVVKSDLAADYFRIYVVLNMAPVDGWETTINFTVKVGETTYAGEASFVGTEYQVPSSND